MGKVNPYNCWDGAGNGASGDEELENLLSILDFPMESLEADGFVGEWDISKSHYLGPIPSDMLIGAPAVAQIKTETEPPVPLHRQVAAPINAIPEPKQLPCRVEETSGSCIHRPNNSTEIPEHGPFQSQSPVSVLENSSTLIKSHVSKRVRSKRARPSGVNPWLLISPPLILSTSRKTCSARKIGERRKKSSQSDRSKKTVENSSHAEFTASHFAELRNAAAAAKKCAHCQVTKTPQWREGPTGPKTLCNACGVRYRSGRLYPEYRPAASPTFIPSLHSNSHKKVIEMRAKAKETEIEGPFMHSPQLEFVPVSSCVFDPIC